MAIDKGIESSNEVVQNLIVVKHFYCHQSTVRRTKCSEKEVIAF